MNLYTFPRDVVSLLRCCFCREGKFPEAFTQSFLPYWRPVCEEETSGDAGTVLVSHLLPLSSKVSLQCLLQGKGLDHAAPLRAQNVMLSFASRVRRRPLNQEGAALGVLRPVEVSRLCCADLQDYLYVGTSSGP